MELFKVTRGSRTKKFYESKKSFEAYWKYNLFYSKHYEIIAYQIDWKNKCWKEIRRASPKRKEKQR